MSIKRPPKKRIDRIDGEAMAKELTNAITKNFSTLVTVGSLRRQSETVGDIEVLGILKPTFDLFQEQIITTDFLLTDLISHGYKICSKGTKQIVVAKYDMSHEIYITTPDQWGIMQLIRTGNVNFSRLMVTPRNLGGVMPDDLRVFNGRIWRENEALITENEEQIFKLYGLPFVEPDRRTI